MSATHSRSPFGDHCWVSQTECNFDLYLAKARGVIEKQKKAEALACVGSFFKAKLKAVTIIHVMYHSTQQSNACDESTLRVRERCVSHGGLDSRSRCLRASYLLCRAARPGSKRGDGVENARGGEAAGA
eukprot:3267266-Pleurochrysis_carterae.AAC.1